MDVWSTVFSFQDYGELLVLVQNSILAGAVLGIVGGLIGPFVVARNMPFAVHGISELSFAGASASLLLGVNVVTGSLVGSVVAALLIGLLGSRARDRNSIIAVLMPFGLGLGILCLALYKGRAANKFGLLTGQIVSVDNPQLTLADRRQRDRRRHADRHLAPADVRERRPRRRRGRAGCPVRDARHRVHAAARAGGGRLRADRRRAARALVARDARRRGPAADRHPLLVPLLAMLFAVVSVVGGILLALGGGLPISPYVTTISFAIWVVCRIVGARKDAADVTGSRSATSTTEAHRASRPVRCTTGGPRMNAVQNPA